MPNQGLRRRKKKRASDGFHPAVGVFLVTILDGLQLVKEALGQLPGMVAIDLALLILVVEEPTGEIMAAVPLPNTSRSRPC